MTPELDFGRHDQKAASNAAKHGVDFADAVRVFRDPERIDVSTARPEDGEDRRKVTGRMGAKLYTKISDAAFRKLILIILSATGVALLVSSVPKL